MKLDNAKSVDVDQRIHYLKEKAADCDTMSELRDVFCDLMQLAVALREDQPQHVDLANAISDFANWQSSSYDRCAETRFVIGRSLWGKVADNVTEITGSCPPSPRFGQQNDGGW